MGLEGAKKNLYAVSDEARSRPLTYRHQTALSSVPNITRCQGWLKLPRSSLPRKWHRELQYDYPDEVDDADYNYAIAYEYIDDSTEDSLEILRHLRFFYEMGFAITQYIPRNWRQGRLEDFCEIAFWDQPLRWKYHWQK
jgi:hypothetical protein